MKKWLIRSLALAFSLMMVTFAACEGLPFGSSSENENFSGSSISESVGDSSKADDSSSSVEELPTECAVHTFGEWETVVKPTCAVGKKERACTKCEVIESEEIPALDDFLLHKFDPTTKCTVCGHQEFINSDEYITRVDGGLQWMSVDGSYGLLLHTASQSGKWSYSVIGYVGTPIEIVIPSKMKNCGYTYPGISDDVPVRSIEYVGPGSAFQDCETLKTVILCEGVEKVGVQTFSGCVALENLILPSTLKRLEGYFIFNGCESLKKIVIPNGIEFSTIAIFSGSALETVYYYGTKKEWESKVFSFSEKEVCFYSEEYKRGHWHYVDGKPVIW